MIRRVPLFDTPNRSNEMYRSYEDNYDDGNIPEVDLPQGKSVNNEEASDIIPDEVPRHDGD